MTQLPSPAVRRQLLESKHPRWRPLTIAHALDSACASHPDRPLVLTDEREYSYRAVKEWSRSLAAGLIALGVKPGDHVAVVLANVPEYVAIKFAIARAGAIAVPINYLLRRDELRYILEQSDSVVLITMNRLRDRDYLADLDELAPDWVNVAGGARLPRLRHVFVCDLQPETRTHGRSLQHLADAATLDAYRELLQRESMADPNACADVIYTSGTTGLPKGVMLTHDMITRVAYASAYTRAFEDGRRILFALPMYHVFGYIECLIASLFVGGAIVPQVVFDAEKMIEALERHHATEIVAVPTMTLKLLEIARMRRIDNSSLLAVFSSGGASPPTIWEDIRAHLGAREVMTAYGMTETTASTTCTLPEDSDQRLLTSNGRLKQAGAAGDPTLGGVLALYKTIDPQSGADLPVGTPGELMARGPCVTKGYYRKADETRSAFDAHGWLHTGDVGVIDGEGYLTLTGRIKETYRCGGEMVMPREIEDLLNRHPGVAQALVVGIPDPKMGEVGCVCVVPAAGERPSAQELIDLCAARLARFKVPRHVVFLTAEDIPLTATGRPQKFRLVEVAKRKLS